MVNIVVFGEVGAGKSSVVNLLAGKQIAHISPDAHRCTLNWTEYSVIFENGARHQVFDTVGLEESRLPTGEYLSAIANAYDLINALKKRGGINLLLFCVRGNRVTTNMQSNYRLFFEFLCEEKVPLALVVTNLEREENMEDWYTRNIAHLEKYNIKSVGHACITAASLLDGRHKDKYEESRGIIREVVQAHHTASMLGWTGGQAWFASFISKLVDFVTGRPKKTDVIGVLTKRCGMTKEMAQQVAQQIRGENPPKPMVENHGYTSAPVGVRNAEQRRENQSRPRNVVLWGESGVGKSSLINLIMGRDIAKTSPDAISCTLNTAPYEVTIKGQCFRLWDTAGLNEGSEGAMPAPVAARNLTVFLRGLNQGDGVHLLVYCVRGTQATKAMRTNYQTFASVIGDSKVPTVIVATCLEDLRPDMAEWWNQNKDQLAKYGMHFSGYACVTTLPGEHADSQDIRQRRVRSYEDVCRLILDHCSQTPHKTWGTAIKDQ
ncbi:P-loop containing nucleoside triphosphate hydrolase protein [Suillus paluster]|uniref:P-loop containing nucleoside triphosphate hydrolase protein n=1 Tax=Suillus paluster TaxID=48578 RepID=UPI001B85B3F6|nr:P-loop containing nucleoside triphosphate hydrolase protein [Suillus paluster]KAG1745358.1 P-loop containing nucleoside triphosphate hydrolase protein [Suillus paluster]